MNTLTAALFEWASPKQFFQYISKNIKEFFTSPHGHPWSLIKIINTQFLNKVQNLV